MNKNLKKMIWASLLTAISVVIDLTFKMFIPTELLGVPFYAIPIIIAAIFLGPKYSILVAFLGDFITLMLSNIPFYVLFAVGSTMWGVIPGLFLINKKNRQGIRLLGVIIFTHIIVTTINSFALMIHYHKSFAGLSVDLPFRLIMIIPNSLLIYSISRAVSIPLEELIWHNEKSFSL